MEKDSVAEGPANPNNRVGHEVMCAPEVIEDEESGRSRNFQRPKTRSAIYNFFTFNERTGNWNCNAKGCG